MDRSRGPADGPIGRGNSAARGRDGSDEARARRLAEVRAMIAGGTYETPERLEGAVARLFAAVGGG